METLKTALVVVLLLAVLYGVYVVLNKPDFNSPAELAAWQQGATAPPEIEFGVPGLDAPATLPALTPLPAMAPSMTTAVPPLAADSAPPAGAAELAPAESAEAPTPLAELSPVAEPAPPPAAYEAQPAGATQYADLMPQPAAAGAASTPPAPARAHSIYEQAGGTAEPSPSAAALPGDQRPARAFEEAWKSALDQLANQHWPEALLTLSLFYDKPDVSGEERQRLVDLLDPLAGKVIYSPEHLLERPYPTRPGETLQQIADSFQVPVSLLQNINRVSDPQALSPGTMLKVLRGPFRAEIQLDKEELVLFLGKYYAGRFAVSVGNDPRPQPGEFRIVGKQQGREYFAPNGAEIAPNAPDNPYGRHWLDLGGDLCIHGSAESMPAHGGLGCISLNSTDAEDVYSILSVGSKVLIR